MPNSNELGVDPGVGVIIVMNRRFVPDAVGGRYIYGVVQHALHLAELLVHHGRRVGFVLYERVDRIDRPAARAFRILDRYDAAVLGYNVAMSSASIEAAFSDAAEICLPMASTSGRRIVYLQTDVLLPYVPGEMPVLLTHHSPFVDSVRREVGDPLTRLAFEWDHPKADFLEDQQRRALELIRARKNVVCLEISALQERYLINVGVPADRVRRLPPPVSGGGGAAKVETEMLAGLLTFMSEVSGPIAVGVVSRFDGFKNMELFVDGCARAIASGRVAGSVVIGGEEEDDGRRRLIQRIDRKLLSKFHFCPRVARADLVDRIFPLLADRGLFICTSRYDLVPYTALEAIISGVLTVAPTGGAVGVSEYLPDHLMFEPTAEGLANLLTSLSGGFGVDRFSSVVAVVRRLTSDESVVDAFDTACVRLLAR